MKTVNPQIKLHPKGILFAFAMIISFSGTFAQSLNGAWKQDMTASLEKFLKCQVGGASNTDDCNQFMGESLNKIYKVNDFYAQKSGKYMGAAEISKFLKETDKWTLLGPSYDQKVLAAAQENANAKKAVVAVYMNASGICHVVIVIPGQLQSSGSWGLNVPNVVSFLPSQPEKSFVDKGLSFAFGKNLMKDIMIYTKKY
ncbi:MAG: hypothetical protein C0490_26485 [Marivirga sp.]|nr:hypothetical protein [Marivirga sp.]